MTVLLRVACFLRDRQGVAAVEFALMLPFMVALLFGSVDLTQGVLARRKLTLASNTVSDLIARAKEVATADVDNVFTAAEAVLTPFPGDLLQTVVTNVVIDNTGRARVGWSRARNTTAHDPGVDYTFPPNVPAGARAPNTSLVVAELRFAYRPVVGYVIVGTLNMADITYAVPRVASIKTGVPCTWQGCPPTS